MSRDQRKYKEIDKQKRHSKRHLAPFYLLPPPRGCIECGREHEPGEPHDPQQLQYQYTFYDREGRWPTWNDALQHCSPEVQQVWLAMLREFGVDPDSQEIGVQAPGREP